MSLAYCTLTCPRPSRRRQGLITNDAAPLEAPDAKPLYACILNAQGRYLHDLFLFRVAEEAQPAVLLDSDAAGADDLVRLLRRYRLRQKVDIDDVSAEYHSWVAFPGPSGTSTSTSTGAAAGWPQDPRLAALGQRTVLPAGSAAEPGQPAPWQAYRLWRIANGVAECDSEIPTGEAVALEYNVDGLHGISFTKGCYVGQELMARTHFKGVVRKRVMPFEVVAGDAGSLRPGEAVLGAGTSGKEDGKPVGTVRVVEGGQGLAHLRLRGALAAAESGQPLRTESGVELRPWRPSWWPPAWGTED